MSGWKSIVASALWSSAVTLLVVWSLSSRWLTLLGWSLLAMAGGAVMSVWVLIERERLRMEHLADLMVSTEQDMADVAHLR